MTDLELPVQTGMRIVAIRRDREWITDVEGEEIMLPGDVLFLGASGSTRADGKWQMTFRFAASPTRENLVLGDITIPKKRGWDYLWIRYQEQEDTAAKMIVRRPVAAYIEQVYPYADLGALGIGN